MTTPCTILYTCPFVPAEWIASHGLKPKRVVPRSSPPNAPIGSLAGVCPYARAFANLAARDDDARAIVVTTVCDQMRRVADLVGMNTDRRVFLFHVPHTWTHPGAPRLYVQELKRLGSFLESEGGVAPTKQRLIDAILLFDDQRRLLREARGATSGRRWAELAATFYAGGVLPTFKPQNQETGKMPLALLGGPVMADHLGLYDLIEQAGGRIALDATETGERSLAAPIDHRLLREDPVKALADAYFGSIPDPFRRPNSLLFQWLEKEIAERRIRGAIVHRYLWCDTWHAEVHRLKEWLKVPLIDLDSAEDGFDDARVRTRLGAFLEGLRS